MTKRLIAITSYFPDAVRGCHQAIREGWGKDVAPAGADLRFFTPYPHFADPPEYGDNLCLDSYQSQPDEVWLKMNGLYNNISYQVQNILKQSLEHGYDFVHICANDSFLIPKKVFSSEVEQYDWTGVWDQQRINRKNPIKEISYGYSKNPDRQPLLFGDTFNWWWYNARIPNLYGWMGGGAGMTLSKKAAEIIALEDLSPWIAKYDFWGFGYDSLFGQILGPHIRENRIIAKSNETFSFHYEHSPNEKRYDGVTTWQKEMYEKYHE